MLDMTELEKSNDVGSFSLYPIHEWGKLYSAHDLSKLIYNENCLLKIFSENDTMGIFKEMNELYEGQGPNLKVEAILMHHYMEPEKMFLRQVYINLSKKLQQESINKSNVRSMKYCHSNFF